MQFLKDAWFKFRQLKTWIQVVTAIFVLSLLGSVMGGSADSTTSDSSSSVDTTSKNQTIEPTPKETEPVVSEKELKTALAQLTIKKDEVKNIKWYYDKSSPRYVDYNGFFIYMGQEGNGIPWLRFKIQYAGDEWLFIESYFINVDGEQFEISPGFGEIERDNDSDVWEWYDVTPTSENLYMLQQIADSKKTIMRIEGRQYYKDVVISQTQKKAIKNILTAYQGLGGSI